MTVILLPIGLLLIFTGLRLWSTNVRLPEAFIRAILLFSFMILISTEVLSRFNLYTYRGLAVFWTVFDILLLLVFVLKFKHRFPSFDAGYSRIRLGLGSVGISGKILVTIILLLILGIFIQGLIYPPNNYDSMTYHMARIVHWVQNGNVDYYPTSILRQLYQPPFAEYCIAQLCILSKSDLWGNNVQLFFLVSTLAVMVAIARELGLTPIQQLLTMFLVVTVPEVILQSSNTQNDVVVSFFIATTIYYCLVCYKEGTIPQYLFLALSISLAILTKATAYIYLTPVLLVFGLAVIIQSFQKRQWSFIYKFLLIFMGVLLINGTFFYRNYAFSGSILGASKAEYQMYANETHSPGSIASNITRNVALHYGMPVLAGITENTVKLFHIWLRQSPDDPNTTFGNVKDFRINPYGTHEDYGANIIQVTLILIMFFSFFLFPHKAQKAILFYFLLIVSMFLLFCLHLKWQPWHSRLHTPLFILITPVMAWCLSSWIPQKPGSIILCVIAFYAVSVLTFNYLRPLCPLPPYTANVKIMDDRFKKYFINRNSALHDYDEISGYLKAAGYKNIGLKLGQDDCEYPLFCDVFSSPVKAIHVDVGNISKTIPQPRPDIDCIVSTDNREELVHRNIKYFNFTPHNTTLFLYKR